MIQFIHPRVRIIFIIIGAFFISGLLMNYYSGESESIPPEFQGQKIINDFSISLSDTKSSLIASFQSIKLPSFESAPQKAPEEVTPPPDQAPTPQEWETVPTVPDAPPTSTPASIRSTPAVPHPTSIIRQPTSVKPIPTAIPQPTKVPAPTKAPKPTAPPALPPITSDARPGSSIEEILQEVSKRACIPYALLMATRTEESGAWMTNMNASVTKFYNTYGWWKSAGKGEVCYALGYYTQSGKIPPDSTTALQEGPSCNNGVQPGAYDQKIMGLMQVSEEEQTRTRKYTTPALPKTIDRRVLFDNALIYAYATKNRLGTTPKNCDDWPEDAVKLVAEKHYGACAYPGGNYCNEIWALYKKFQ